MASGEPDPSPRLWKLHAHVHGRVQGVFFRESTRREAAALALSGWVRNLPDGCVECCFIGARDACERALAFVREGPPRASVTHVEAKWEEMKENVTGGFEIR